MIEFLKRVRKMSDGRYVNMDTRAIVPTELVERYAQELGVEILDVEE